ncbi:MAG: hypothetical protein A3I44_06185 [Candidatus Sungbacteria bacterium RIFCSPLOWO2_02_FULL_51_17]|uniref:Fatty acid desaturase domain-containing protein n=1 Tax=Candidatus Sungbacteria bacterium RIFCSPHIGHO2_02_FULL_51_29 TaxID=1802273 RepID=A0A1G2KQC6_9BACT|nr:MAG: hypothetical protein A2676_04500 [Candidatus Sungbacteria bacterium RIFCSPHIGHO2_01_FULL_51_22]OHA01630.1 MAG: hypothetical protein A3C16_02560 [Candidatus Sungbacteria bacterium RIFCSPHIGHO2_02_FULL_51_29]OHA06452.1 MAG: hypothetical protein A3B29_04650 [Candidatus Sungbacteria bacterium RIFCSPLOWO2_01_FULL_51_34]OHA10391.1 MAG: hypothetical protein A3I44_06185 [Candidatus Sungbacteria bacterium RIFCSPLOWO2_02_FULL_51_17]
MPKDGPLFISNFSFWWHIGLPLLFLHLTMTTVSIYIHRAQTHGALTLHPAISHCFRAWQWLTTGMVTKEWVAVHRKHHAHVETALDPHSPKFYGLWHVIFFGAFLYRNAARDEETIRAFAKDIMNDRLEQMLYARYSYAGLLLMLVIDVILFGAVWGAGVWIAQMLCIPVFGAGAINGFGHSIGYRNYATNDASRNILPFGFVMAGEELHNNHHEAQWSAKFSHRPWEYDISWLYIRTLRALRLAHHVKVRRVHDRTA